MFKERVFKRNLGVVKSVLIALRNSTNDENCKTRIEHALNALGKIQTDFYELGYQIEALDKISD